MHAMHEFVSYHTNITKLFIPITKDIFCWNRDLKFLTSRPARFRSCHRSYLRNGDRNSQQHQDKISTAGIEPATSGVKDLRSNQQS